MKPFLSSTIACCLFGLTVGFVPLVSLAKDVEEKPRLPLAMEVFLKKPRHRLYELHVHLTNISDEPVPVGDDIRHTFG